MGFSGESQKEKVQRWRRDLEQQKISHEEAFQLIDTKILPKLMNSDSCLQSELYKGQSERVKNIVRGIIKSLSQQKKPTLVMEKKGSTYVIRIKNKNDLKKDFKKVTNSYKDRLREQEKSINLYEKKYVKEKDKNKRNLSTEKVLSETTNQVSSEKISAKKIDFDIIFKNLIDTRGKSRHFIELANLSDEQKNNLKFIMKKSWDKQSTENLLILFNDYGAPRFWSWCFRDEIKYFLDDIIGEKSEELLGQLKTFFKANSISALPVGFFITEFYKEILKQHEMFHGIWDKKNVDKITRKCSICGNLFNPYLVEWYYTKKPSKFIQICDNCYEEADIIRSDKFTKKTKNEMLTDLQNFVELLGFIPDQNLGKCRDIIDNIPEKKEVEAITLMKNMHSFSQYRHQFGSYFKALVEAGLLEEGVRVEGRGTRCIALDGHECQSLAEQYIDNWLFRNNIPHDREPFYPETSYRADWKVGDYFIEYWGLKGNDDYDEKIDIKRDIAKKNDITLIEIDYSDLPKLNSIFEKIKPLADKE